MQTQEKVIESPNLNAGTNFPYTVLDVRNDESYRYVLEYRLSKAAEYLRNTAEPIGVIASSVGFHQASHFGKCFREKTGLSPGEYRKQRS